MQKHEGGGGGGEARKRKKKEREHYFYIKSEIEEQIRNFLTRKEMSSSNETSSYANPVLYYFIGFQVQPYWVFIAELLFLQLLQRLYSLIESACKKKKKHIYIALELTMLGKKRTGISPPKYSILDFILSLVSVGHFCYACYMQTECGNAKNGEGWNCYNAFGYRLHNFILPGCVAVLVESIVQCVNLYRANKENEMNEMKEDSLKWLKWTLLITTMILNGGVFLAFIPFFVSNTIPMIIAYCWLLLPILGGVVLIYASIVTIIINSCRKCEGCGCCFFWKFFGTHCVVGSQVFGCLIFAMAYNYSQYSYFGADYSDVMYYEYQSRDTINWFNNLKNNSDKAIHNLLTPF